MIINDKECLLACTRAIDKLYYNTTVQEYLDRN